MLLRLEEHLQKQRWRRKLKLREKMLTVCAYCKNVRDETASPEHRWLSMEMYLHIKSDIALSHGCCPSCFEEVAKEWDDDG